MRKLGKSFFNKSAITVAKSLLGCFVVRKIGGKVIRGKIVETEAYEGIGDRASHACRGRTKRNEPMFGESARAYIYLIYGMYYCFNIVTGPIDHPAAVLIRAVEVNGKDSRIASGPGKFCRAFLIDKRLNLLDLSQSKSLLIFERKKPLGAKEITAVPRIGVDYAGPWRYKKWRFYIKDNPAVSKK